MAEDAIPIDGEIGFWWARVSSWKSALDGLHGTLQVEERRLAARFRVNADRERFILARALLRLVLARCLDCAPSEVAFEREPLGKLFIAGRRPEFNVSHSGDWILSVICPDRRVGVDVEQIRHGTKLDSVAARALSREEKAELAESPETDKAAMFLSVWTRKEALLKAAGLGLRTALREITVGAGSVDRGFQPVRGARAIPGDWSVASLPLEADYKAALAVEGAPPRRVLQWTPTPPRSGRPFPPIQFKPSRVWRPGLR